MTETPNNETGPDLEGCTNRRHCHARRRRSQPDAVLPNGRVKACHRPAGSGTSHPGYGTCKYHGGSTPAANVRAQRLMMAEQVAVLGLPVDVAPEEALLGELRHTAGHVAWLRGQIQLLDPDALTWSVSSESIGNPYRDDNGEWVQAGTVEVRARIHDLYEMYLRERRHMVDVAARCIAAGVQERVVRMYEQAHEQAADAFVGLVDRVLNALDLTDEQRERVPEIITAELRVMTGDTA